MSVLQPSSLHSFDLYVQRRTLARLVSPLESLFFGVEPASKPLQILSQSKNWENLQSVSYKMWESVLSAQPLRLEPDQPPQRPPAVDPETQKMHKRKEHLTKVAAALADTLPSFFTKMHDYTLYNQEIIFDNRIRGITTEGLKQYVIQLNKYKSMAHVIYSHVKMEVLKITEHPEDNTVRVRWRVQTIGGIKPILQFWKMLTPKGRKGMVEYIDGFSTFVVGDDGLVCKHIADKMMPDDETLKARTMPAKLAKLAAFVGFMVPLAIVE